MRALWLVLAITVAGCSNHVGPDGRVVGGACVDEFDCANGSYCLRSPDFPDGACTTNCRGHADCRGDSLCVDLASGVCLLSCEVDGDCGREGWVCDEVQQRSEPGRVSVCVGG